jgi:proton-coupled amino acid transporter
VSSFYSYLHPLQSARHDFSTDRLFVCLSWNVAILDLIFISTNAQKLFGISKELMVLLCVPPLIGFSFLKHMKELAYVALAADCMNFAGLCVVYVSDFSYMAIDQDILKYNVWSTIPFFFGVASYCYEGVGMVLPLENSMRHKHNFGPLFVSTVVIITCIYATFGICGYLAFGNATQDVITMNFDAGSTVATTVQLCLCVGLFFTYPLMLFPVFEVVHSANSSTTSNKQKSRLVRASIVCCTAILATGIPSEVLFFFLTSVLVVARIRRLVVFRSGSDSD